MLSFVFIDFFGSVLAVFNLSVTPKQQSSSQAIIHKLAADFVVCSGLCVDLFAFFERIFALRNYCKSFFTQCKECEKRGEERNANCRIFPCFPCRVQLRARFVFQMCTARRQVTSRLLNSLQRLYEQRAWFYKTLIISMIIM